MSPRRSSRARSAQQPATASQANSSSSGSTTTKGDRSTRSNNIAQPRANSPRRASNTRSESIDDAESTSRSAHTAESSLPPRRSRRGNDAEPRDRDIKVQPEEDDDPGEEAIEEDITRCICGHAEYPGPGISIQQQFSSTELVSDDIGNFFVQCDKCHVWQHGGCMGLVDESLLQDKDQYYCEQCKPEYHKILKGPDGIKSSRYLPLLEASSARSSPTSSTEAPKKSNSKRTFENTKRRATMNSRVAYDEDEMLRRAIEESKEMGTLGKRTRDDLDDQRPVIKRQRTASSLSSGASRRSASPATLNGESSRSAANGTRSKNSNKPRGAAAKTSREKELRDKHKEQVAALRAEAASKRNARSERRRGEDSPPPTPSISPSKLAQANASAARSKAETPPSSKANIVRKGGRPPARRGRLGRSQYVREPQNNGETSDSPMRDTSNDRRADSPRPHTSGNINGESGRSSKAKTHSARTSMNEMKRRVAAILEFVGRMQTERRPQVSAKVMSSTGHASSKSSESASAKGDRTPNRTLSVSDLPTASLIKAVTDGLEEARSKQKQATMNEDHKIRDDGSNDEDTSVIPVLDIGAKDGKEFEEMNAIEMMEILTKDLVSWQGVYGIYAK